MTAVKTFKPRTSRATENLIVTEEPIPAPNCPLACRVNNHIPMAHVGDVNRSLRFYALMGFSCESRFSGDDGVPYFASIEADRARLMLARASGPVDPKQQAVLFYMYSPDVAGLREHLLKRGLADGGKPPGEYAPGDAPTAIPEREAVYEITRPFYMPDGEMRVHDPDGYCILVGQLSKTCPEPT